jgi:hypothetical protein
MIADRSSRPLDPETLQAALAEPHRLALYLSYGHGPPPPREPRVQPEFVRVAVMTSAPWTAVQAAREAWLAEAARRVAGPLRTIEPAELVLPGSGSRWAAVPGEARAGLVGRGIELLLSLAPEIGVFHIDDAFGGGMLGRVQLARATGEAVLDVSLLEHLVYASLTHRLMVHPGEAVVVAEAVDSTWSLRQVFPEHAAVWRRSLARAPAEQIGGLMFAGLAELVVWATATGQGRAELSAGAPAIQTAIEAAARSLRPRLANLLLERRGGTS